MSSQETMISSNRRSIQWQTSGCRARRSGLDGNGSGHVKYVSSNKVKKVKIDKPACLSPGCRWDRF